MARIECVAVAAVFMVAFVVAVANQCSSGGEKLQVNDQKDKGGGEGPSDNKPKSIVSLLQTKLHVNVDAEEVDPWRLKEYRLLHHRKGGTHMCGRAAHNMQRAVDDQLGSPKPRVVEYSSGRVVAYDSAEPICYAHVARNPFEIVVSGYLYNMAGSEAWWKKTKFGQCLDDHDHGAVALAELFRSSHSGHLSALLPNASSDETYAEYLKRVDLDAGLLAEFIVASIKSLAPMRLATDFTTTESQHCSIDVCYEDFFENCGATWHRVLQAWQIPEHPYDAMFRAATESCPGADPMAAVHSSTHQMEKRGLSHAAEHVMVNRLRELDRIHLDGRVAALEEHVKCPVSGKYKEPA